MLLLRRGMRTWLEASQQYADNAAPSPPAGFGRDAVMTPELRSEAVFILAGMALRSRQEASGR